jgi:NitT/TauT family transport system permease protein
LSTNVQEPRPLPADLSESRPAPGGATGRGGAAAAVMSPSVAALAALLVHQLVPNKQVFPVARAEGLAAWLRPYPLLLMAALAAAILAAAAQWAWPRLRPWVRHHAPLLAGALLALLLWDLATLKLDLMPLPYFPGPSLVLQGMLEDRAMLLDSTYHSLKLLLAGYAGGVVAGLFSGILMGWSRGVRYWGMPVMKLVGPIPATAFIPLAMSVFPNAFVSGASLIALAVWFPVTMLTTSGLANVPLSYFDVARTLGAGRLYLIFRVAVPAALPHIFVGLFMGLGASFLTLIVAETVGVRSGLGWYLEWQRGYAEYAKVYGALVIMAVFFSTIMTLLFKTRDRVLAWQKGVIRW